MLRIVVIVFVAAAAVAAFRSVIWETRGHGLKHLLRRRGLRKRTGHTTHDASCIILHISHLAPARRGSIGIGPTRRERTAWTAAPNKKRARLAMPLRGGLTSTREIRGWRLPGPKRRELMTARNVRGGRRSEGPGLSSQRRQCMHARLGSMSAFPVRCPCRTSF